MGRISEAEDLEQPLKEQVRMRYLRWPEHMGAMSKSCYSGHFPYDLIVGCVRTIARVPFVWLRMQRATLHQRMAGRGRLAAADCSNDRKRRSECSKVSSWAL
jgi:hypothetical protein